MTLEILSRSEIGRGFHLVLGDGSPSKRAVADILRSAIFRWRLAPRRAVLRFARQQIDAAGLRELYPASDVASVLDQLVSIGDCQEVRVGSEKQVAATTPRWIRTGWDDGAILGCVEVASEIPVAVPEHGDDVVRRLKPCTAEVEAALHLAGVEQSTLDQWLGAPQFIAYASRRMGRTLRDDAMSLGDFWQLLATELHRNGQPLNEEAELRVLVGPPGGHFGRHVSPALEGRWKSATTDGLWCGYRRGYDELHWHPVLVEIEGNDRRSLDLFDVDEWNWALLSRAHAVGQPEVVSARGGRQILSFPLPAQLRNALDILGQRDGAWSWKIAEDAPNLWTKCTGVTMSSR